MTFLEKAVNDLRLLVLLHHREPSPDLLSSLRGSKIVSCFELPVTSPAGKKAAAEMDAYLRQQPDDLGSSEIDALAVEYANIYLSHVYRAAPSESVWFDEEGLERQAPFFQTKDWFKRFNLRLETDEGLPEDHLLNQLRFLIHLLDIGDPAEAGRFMDEHLLRWVPLFANQVAQRARSAYFIGLAKLTDAYLDLLRDQIENETQIPRPSDEHIKALLAGKRRIGGLGAGCDDSCASS